MLERDKDWLEIKFSSDFLKKYNISNILGIATIFLIVFIYALSLFLDEKHFYESLTGLVPIIFIFGSLYIIFKLSQLIFIERNTLIEELFEFGIKYSIYSILLFVLNIWCLLFLDTAQEKLLISSSLVSKSLRIIDSLNNVIEIVTYVVSFAVIIKYLYIIFLAKEKKESLGKKGDDNGR